MFPHFIQPHLIINNLHSDIEPHPNHNGNGGDCTVYRYLRGYGDLTGKQVVDENGRFWSILAKSFPIVSPTNLRWGNANKENHDYNSNRI